MHLFYILTVKIIKIRIMITIYIYTSKTYSSTTTYMKSNDLHQAPVSITSHKGGGIFKFNGTRKEFINKVVQTKYLANPTGYSLKLPNGTTLDLFGGSPLHTPSNESNFISGLKLNDEFINYLKDKFSIPKTYLSYGQNGAGIFIIEDDAYPTLDF